MSSNRLRIRGSVHHQTLLAREAGELDLEEPIEVLLRLRGKAEAPDLDTVFAGAPGSIGRLTRGRFEKDYGRDANALQLVETFASKNELEVLRVSGGGRYVALGGCVRKLSDGFNVRLATFDGPRGAYIGHTEEISIPEELSEFVIGVFGLDRRPIARPYFHRSTPFAKTSTTGSLDSDAMTPPQVADVYQFPAGADGAGECIGIIELEGGYQDADLQIYFESLGLSVPDITDVPVAGGSNLPLGFAGSPDTEVLLDIEVAGSVAPGAKLAVYFAPNTEMGFIEAVATAIHDADNALSVLSISWGEDEKNWTGQATAALNELCREAGLLGVTVCAASGDHGSTDGVRDGKPHVSFPASSPWVLACGGTTLELNDGQRSGETVWNESAQGGGVSGGGLSTVFPRPDYQQNIGGSATDTTGGRGVPDVAAHADSESPASAYVIRVDGQTSVIGGTSAAAPLWAALIARLNQGLGRPLGFLNPFLYCLPADNSGLQDITEGTNGFFQAEPGWDACTGLGSPNGSGMLALLNNLKPPEPTKPKKREPAMPESTERTSSPAIESNNPALAGIRQAEKEGRLAGGRITELCSSDGIKIPAVPDPVIVILPHVNRHLHLAGPKPKKRQQSSPQAPDRQPDQGSDATTQEPEAGSGGIKPMFDSAEHVAIGDEIDITLSTGPDYPNGMVVKATDNPITLPNGLSLTIGQILALAGDFFGDISSDGTVSEISDDPNPPTVFMASFNALATDTTDAPTYVANILNVMQIEVDALDQAAVSGDQPSTAYANIAADGIDLDGLYNEATGGSATFPYTTWGTYLYLASVNWDHFGEHAITAYSMGHAAALQKASAAGSSGGTVAEQNGALQLAYAMDAFACHFLSDIFAAGHTRTPRKELYEDGTPSEAGSACSKFMHDEDNHFGLLVSNANGDKWQSFGDSMYFDTMNTNNRQMVHSAVQSSANEIWAAFSSGNVPASSDYAALGIVPDLTALNDHTDQTNGSMLFYYSGSTGYNRNDITDLTDYSWTKWWTAASQAAENYKYSGDWGEYTPPASTISPPGSAISQNCQWSSTPSYSFVWIAGNSVRYAVSFFDKTTGNESALSPWSTWFEIPNQEYPEIEGIPVCSSPPSGISSSHIGRKIYRQFKTDSTGNNTTIQLAGTINDNTTTTFSDPDS